MKNISKSIRISQKTYDYINEFGGNGFNQKLENMILFFMECEKDYKKRLEELDRVIYLRNEELIKLNYKLCIARKDVDKLGL